MSTSSEITALQDNDSVLLGVISNYVDILQYISYSTLINDKLEARNKRKYKVTKMELYNFISNHKQFFKLTKLIKVSQDRTFEDIVAFNYDQTVDEFLKFSNFVKHFEKINEVLEEKPDTIFFKHYDFALKKHVVIHRIETLLNKQTITNEDIKQFFANNFLINKHKLHTKCSNYYELEAYIKQRSENFLNCVVSTRRIDEMSFAFQIENFEGETSCGICLSDYQNGQQVCRLPCHHFCCKICAVRWFEVSKDGSKSKFLCPFCRDDCT